jgi:hypothetical protein
MVQKRRGEELTAGRRRRGPGALEFDGGVDLVLLGVCEGDDGVQQWLAMAKEEPQGCPVTLTGRDWRLGRDGEVKDVVDLVLY